MEMGFRWDFAYEILPQMLWATLNTIIAAGVGYAIALVVGLFFLLGQRTPSKIVNAINYFNNQPNCVKNQLNGKYEPVPKTQRHYKSVGISTLEMKTMARGHPENMQQWNQDS